MPETQQIVFVPHPSGQGLMAQPTTMGQVKVKAVSGLVTGGLITLWVWIWLRLGLVRQLREQLFGESGKPN